MKKLSTITTLTCIAFGMLCSLTTPLWSFQDGSYAGIALEWQRFEGDRRDTVIAQNGAKEPYNNQNADNNKAGFEIFGGYLFPCFCERVLIGYEGYLAYDFNKDTKQGLISDTFEEISSLQRKFNAGIVFKGGIVVCNDYFIYGLVGPDIGYFKWKQSGEGSRSFSKNNALVGVRCGVGIERDFCCFRVGLQVDCTHYKPKTFSATDSNGETRTSHFKPNIFNVGLRCSVPL